MIYISTNSIIDKGWRKLNIWDLLRFLFMLLNIEVCIAACLLRFEHESIKESSHNTSSCMVKWFGLESWDTAMEVWRNQNEVDDCGECRLIYLFSAGIEDIARFFPKTTD